MWHRRGEATSLIRNTEILHNMVNHDDHCQSCTWWWWIIYHCQPLYFLCYLLFLMWFQVKANTFHNVHTVSETPSCYMYTYVNKTEASFRKGYRQFEEDYNQSASRNISMVFVNSLPLLQVTKSSLFCLVFFFILDETKLFYFSG